MKSKIVCLLLVMIVVSYNFFYKKSGLNSFDIKINPHVDTSYFTAANENIKVNTIDCILSDGTRTKCYEIVTNSTPTDHEMGPWCPENISDDERAGGIWLKGGKVYDVDGAFIKNMATFYQDDTWQMYDANGKIFVTQTEQDCINAARPQVGEEYKNFCVECLPTYISGISKTWVLPIAPIFQDKPTPLLGARGRERPPPLLKWLVGDPSERSRRPPPKKHRGPATRGVALNGVEFSAPAPVNHILAAYTVAPFDDAGGHINVHQGYHYHAATGKSFFVEQPDGHAPLIGYAMDGFGIYALLDQEGNEPTNLDECRGQYDEIRGYHYHVDAAGNNNFINCLHGASARQ